MVDVRCPSRLRLVVIAAALQGCGSEYPGADLIPILDATEEETLLIRETLRTLGGVTDDFDVPLRQIRVLDDDDRWWYRTGIESMGSYTYWDSVIRLRRNFNTFRSVVWHEFGHAVDNIEPGIGNNWTNDPLWAWRNDPDQPHAFPVPGRERLAYLFERGPGLLGIALPLVDSRSDCENVVLAELRWLADKGVRTPNLARGEEEAALWTLEWPPGWEQTEPAINGVGRWFLGGACPERLVGCSTLFATGDDLVGGPDGVTRDATSGDGWTSAWEHDVEHPLFDRALSRLSALPDGRELMMEKLNFPEDEADPEMMVVFTSDPATGELTTVDSICYRVGEGRYPPVVASREDGVVLMVFDQRRVTAHGWGSAAPTGPPTQFGLKVTQRKDGGWAGDLVRSP